MNKGLNNHIDATDKAKPEVQIAKRSAQLVPGKRLISALMRGLRTIATL